MRTIGFHLFDQGVARISGIIQAGADDLSWTYLDGPIGVHAPRENVPGAEVYSIRISAGVLDGNGRGGVRFDRIELDFGEPVSVDRTGATVAEVNGGRVILGGDGRHCIPPRGALRVRVALGTDPSVLYARPRLSKSVRLTPTFSVPIPDSLAIFADYWAGKHNPIGMRRWWGSLDSGGPGGEYLDFLAGYEGSCALALWRSDGAMNRENVDCLRASDGLPATPGDSREYGWWRVWNRYGQLTEFCDTPTPYEYDRRPLWWNDGPCPYENQACAIDIYSAPAPNNFEHKRRTTAPLEVAVEQWGDKLAAIDRMMVAADTSYSWSPHIDELVGQSVARAGQGHSVLGGRGPAWAVDAMHRDHATSFLALQLVRATERVQTEAGTCRRIRPEEDWGSPAMYVASQDIPDPLPRSMDGCQLMEEIINAWTRARCGHVDSARLLLDRMFRSERTWRRLFVNDPSMFERWGHFPKFLGVSENGVPVRRITRKAGGQDYFPWVAAAMGVYLSRDKQPFIDAMKKMPSPYGRVGVTVEGTIANLRMDPPKAQTAFAIAALESLGQ